MEAKMRIYLEEPVAQKLPDAAEVTIDRNHYYRQFLHGYYQFDCVVSKEIIRSAKFYIPEGSIYNPVSYTHLDVYKRQGELYPHRESGAAGRSHRRKDTRGHLGKYMEGRNVPGKNLYVPLLPSAEHHGLQCHIVPGMWA